MLQLVCLEMYSDLANTSQLDTMWSTVSSYCEHILPLLSTCWPHITFGSFWCLLHGLELLLVASLLLSGYLIVICWWSLYLHDAFLGSLGIGHAMLYFSPFLLSIISSWTWSCVLRLKHFLRLIYLLGSQTLVLVLPSQTYWHSWLSNFWLKVFHVQAPA